MTEQTLRELRNSTPFAPFEITFFDGKSVTVISPDYLYLIPGSSEFMAVKPSGGFRIADIDQVASINREPDLPQSY